MKGATTPHLLQADCQTQCVLNQNPLEFLHMSPLMVSGSPHLLPGVAQKALDQSVDLCGFPARAEHSAHLVGGDAPVLVAVQFDEQLVEIPQLCQVFPRSDVRQKSAVQARLNTGNSQRIWKR